MEEVIVIGSGPAGCTAAIALCLRGRGVTLLERERHPRFKLCAGGLPPKVVGVLPIDPRRVVEREAARIRFSFDGGARFTLSFPRPVLHLVDRSQLDFELILQATRLGARLEEGVRVHAVMPRSQGVDVATSRGEVRARAVVAADGSVGCGAGLLGRTGIRLCPTLQAEVRVDDRELVRWEGMLGCDFGIVPGGIAWVFPKRDRLSVGVCTFRPPVDLRQAWHRLLDRMDIRPAVPPVLHSHPFPAWDGRRVFSAGAALVAGDAAGLVNPLTGAGIRRACISGQLAAEAIHAYLSGGARCPEDLRTYERRIREDLLDELERARLFSRVFYRAPRLFHRIGVMNARVNPWVGELLSGQKSYVEVFRELLAGRWLKRS